MMTFCHLIDHPCQPKWEHLMILSRYTMLLMHIAIISHTYMNLFILLLKAWWRKAPFFPSWYSQNLVSQLYDFPHWPFVIPSSNNMDIPFIRTHKNICTSFGTMVISLVGSWNMLVLLDHLSIRYVSSSLSNRKYGSWRIHPIPTYWSKPISFSMSLSFMTNNFFQHWDIGLGSMRNWWHYKHKKIRYA